MATLKRVDSILRWKGPQTSYALVRSLCNRYNLTSSSAEKLISQATMQKLILVHPVRLARGRRVYYSRATNEDRVTEYIIRRIGIERPALYRLIIALKTVNRLSTWECSKITASPLKHAPDGKTSVEELIRDLCKLKLIRISRRTRMIVPISVKYVRSQHSKLSQNLYLIHCIEFLEMRGIVRRGSCKARQVPWGEPFDIIGATITSRYGRVVVEVNIDRGIEDFDVSGLSERIGRVFLRLGRKPVYAYFMSPYGFSKEAVKQGRAFGYRSDRFIKFI